ncbi:MAG TPA: chemotaxis protein CheA [Sulfuricurvum sp.]|nr:MAG: chemotaxis protein CheA [Campylobacterales bacterium 16-40-21]OZA02497.1 MAG: chemotaxis protein CheA [Sulfuricurvum sp. 17-40-25]HQS67326.1 chemotaxis protein CheA [Sulfuricurvum sp.]HQT36077.1 chemotaxis protein CheA [Sulfuricurvum sp.]
MNPLLEQFLLEARENLAFIDQNIEHIGGDDPELLNSVFRAAHTLKGGSGIVGFEAVKRITHHAEDLLDMLRSGKLEFQPNMIESLFNAFDEVVNLIEAAEECGDIVEADEARIDQISEELSALMGKKIEIQTWTCPYRLASDSERVVNLPMPFLRQYWQTIPFKLGEIDESFCDNEQLYAIIFDLDESCMVYGNDPLYALSLLGNKVVGIHSCMGENSSKALLSGFDDPDGLLLRLSMTAFVYATYEEISDALFNFVDELTFVPLDIATLLGISEGESGHALDVLKELSTECNGVIDALDRFRISEKINNTLPMIGRDTLQSNQLRRLDELLNTIADADLNSLKAFFAQLPQGKVYVYDGLINDASPVEDVSTPVTMCKPIEMNDLERIQLKAILTQQLQTLEMLDDEAAQERVLSILENNLKPYICEMPSTFASKEAMMEWLRSEIRGEEHKSVPEAAPVFEISGVEAPISMPAEPAEVKVYSEPATAVPKVVPVASTVERVESDNQVASSKKGVIGKTVKVDQESIDHLMNVVGELLVAKNSLPYLADGVHKMTGEVIKRAIMEKYTFINRLAEQLQDLIMSMRMLPISYVFDRYPKLVRDISKDMNKKVSLSMDGGETKLDKNMIEMLADPMIHIMRNSLDHGIEMPDVRIQKGKNPEGSITLNAYAQSDKIIIEIRDDGAGINIDRVVQKVLEKELLTLEQVEAMSDDEKAALVMLPGLSTADTISEYSGRGVGMDVVRKSIEGFGGNIRIKTIPNQGTTIYLSIPVSLAVTSLLHVTMSGVHYGFPMDSVSETVKIESSKIEYLQNEPFIYLRGEVIPLLFAKNMLDEGALENKALPVVVLNIKGNLLAVVVNELLGQLDVVQKPLEGIMEHHPIFSGTALLGNGQIIMAIDPIGILGISTVLKSDHRIAS